MDWKPIVLCLSFILLLNLESFVDSIELHLHINGVWDMNKPFIVSITTTSILIIITVVFSFLQTQPFQQLFVKYDFGSFMFLIDGSQKRISQQAVGVMSEFAESREPQ